MAHDQSRELARAVAAAVLGLAAGLPPAASGAADSETVPTPAAYEVHVGYGHMRAVDVQAAFETRVTPSIATFALGIPESFASPEASVGPRPSATLTLGLARRLSEHWSVQLDVGVPPKVAIEGRGVAAPPGAAGAIFRLDLGDPAINPLVTQRQWSPVLAAQYRFGPLQAPLRPFVSVGATYTWFTELHINPAFARALDERFGQPLAIGAVKPGPTSAHVSAQPLWAPVLAAGFSYAYASPWAVTVTAGYAPFRVEGRLDLTAADGSLLSRTRATVDVGGLAANVALTYRITR